MRRGGVRVCTTGWVAWPEGLFCGWVAAHSPLRDPCSFFKTLSRPGFHSPALRHKAVIIQVWRWGGAGCLMNAITFSWSPLAVYRMDTSLFDPLITHNERWLNLTGGDAAWHSSTHQHFRLSLLQLMVNRLNCMETVQSTASRSITEVVYCLESCWPHLRGSPRSCSERLINDIHHHREQLYSPGLIWPNLTLSNNAGT